MKNLFLTLGLSVALPLHAWAADAGAPTTQQSPTPVEAEKPASKTPITSPVLETDIKSTSDSNATAAETGEEKNTSAKMPTPREISDQAFSIRDQNKDGIITSYEYTVYTKMRFATLDSDRDGFVTIDEYFKIYKDKAGTPESPSVSEIFFAMEDKDKDGKVTQYENMTNSSEFLKKMDTNQDEEVSRDEFFVYYQESVMNRIKNP